MGRINFMLGLAMTLSVIGLALQVVSLVLRLAR